MIFRGGKPDAREIRFERCANEVNRRRALSIDQFSVERIDCPDAIQFEAAIGADARLGNAHGIERFDGMETNAGEVRQVICGGHTKSLAKMERGVCGL